LLARLGLHLLPVTDHAGAQPDAIVGLPFAACLRPEPPAPDADSSPRRTAGITLRVEIPAIAQLIADMLLS
jgi:hypothetical protein